MKKYLLNIPMVRLLVVCMSIIIISCSHFDELKSPIDGFKVKINYDIFNSFLSFRFVDAATGSVIGVVDDEKVKLNITGASAGAVVDQMGKHETSYESVYGLLSLALNPKDPWKPSSQNILSIQIEATSNKYKPANLNLKIDSTGKYQYRVMMEKLDVDQSGVKTYFFPLSLDKDGKLIDNFSFTSTGGEASLQLKAGTQFQKSSGDIEKGDLVYLTFKVYTKISAVPVANSLLADVVLKDGTSKKTALDLYRVVDVAMKNNASEILTTPLNYPLVLRYKIEKTAYQPETRKSIIPGNNLKTYTYLSKSTAWQLDDALNLKTDSLGYYVSAETTNFALHSAGMHIDLCNMDGNMTYKLQGVFPTYPVPAAVYLYRKIDYRYISNMKVDIPESVFQKTLSFKVPENTPVSVNTGSYSYNSFLATPQYFYFEPGCGTFESRETNITSTSVVVSGKVKINFTEDFPDLEFYVNAQIYNSANNGLLWSKQYKISRSLNELDISASLASNQSVYLKLSAVKSENSFESNPVNFGFNTTSGQGKVWEFSITPLFSRVNLKFHITRSSDLPTNDYTLKADFTNIDTQGDEGNLVFQLKTGQTDYTAQMFLSKKKNYKINLKRITGTPEFMAYPYEFSLGNSLQKEYSFESELSPVVRKTITITAKVVCPKSEIIPSMHGYYRTVWEDEWKEADIKNGVLTGECEINGTYQIGLIIDGKMEITTLKLDDKVLYFEFGLTDDECSKMGW